MKAKIERDFYRGGVKLYVKSGGRIAGYLKGNLEWIHVEDNKVPPEDACISISEEDVFTGLPRAILDAAVAAGIMPDQSQLKGELEATKRHLADMQKAFNKLLEGT